MNYEQIIDGVIAREKGYVDHPDDRGGPTRYGITQLVARREGYTGPMAELPMEVARRIYRRRYISDPWFDRVGLVSEAIAEELIDTGVNMGPGTASTFLQRWLNALNGQGSHYADLFVDGRIGEVTVDALRKYVRHRGADGVLVMVEALNGTQAVRYLEIAERDPSQESFIYGQLLHRVARPLQEA